jgi:hypothetical protein
VWSDSEKSHVAILVRSFLDEATEELSLGAEILRGHDPKYPGENWSQTVPLVRSALEEHERRRPGDSVLTPFAQTCAFDAWIGNADRHQENWGMIRSVSGGFRLAPMFDPAACLGVELDDANRLFDATKSTAAAIQKYMLGCPSGFGGRSEDRQTL